MNKNWGQTWEQKKTRNKTKTGKRNKERTKMASSFFFFVNENDKIKFFTWKENESNENMKKKVERIWIKRILNSIFMFKKWTKNLSFSDIFYNFLIVALTLFIWHECFVFYFFFPSLAHSVQWRNKESKWERVWVKKKINKRKKKSGNATRQTVIPYVNTYVDTNTLCIAFNICFFLFLLPKVLFLFLCSLILFYIFYFFVFIAFVRCSRSRDANKFKALKTFFHSFILSSPMRCINIRIFTIISTFLLFFCMNIEIVYFSETTEKIEAMNVCVIERKWKNER